LAYLHARYSDFKDAPCYADQTPAEGCVVIDRPTQDLSDKDLKLSLVVIIMAVDVIYFYEAWAVWMHKKFKYKTVFKPHHH
jgi:hypothetical protein